MMELGAFSVSLAVKDIEKSKAFYKKLGFEPLGGKDCGEKWTILKNGEHVIGLFEGMFTDNILTFNPGWSQSAEELAEFTDVRELRDELVNQGVELVKDQISSPNGAGSFMISDPDGNTILIDQHR